MEPGESISEAGQREALEETGLRVRVQHVVGVYSSPDIAVEYPDGNLVQIVSVLFQAAVEAGELGVAEETTDHGYFTLEACASLDVMANHRQRVEDAFAYSGTTFIR
jgi:glycerol 3-phosphatase-2